MRSVRLAAWSQDIDERRTTTALKNGGMSVREAMERMWNRLSLSCWRLEAWTERLVRPLSVAELPLEVVTVVDRPLPIRPCTGGQKAYWGGSRSHLIL